MKKLIFIIGSAFIIILSSCLKNDGNDNTDKKTVNYDALYVVNRASSSLSVVNLSGEKVEKTITLDSAGTMMGGPMMGGNSKMWPDNISLSPDNSKLVVTQPGMDFDGGFQMMMNISSSDSAGHIRGNILIIDATTGDILKKISLEGIPYNAIFSPDGKEIWVTLMLPVGKVIVFSADSYNLLNSVDAGTMPAGITFSEDGKKVFVVDGMAGLITVIDAITKTVTGTIVSGHGSVGAFLGMDGMMYTDNEKNQTIGIVNTMNNMMSDSIRTDFSPGMVSRNSMMKQLWVSDPSAGKIHLWNQSENSYKYGGSVTVGNGAGAMLFSRDGKTCYVANQNDNTVSVVDVKALQEKMKIQVGEKPGALAIRYNK